MGRVTITQGQVHIALDEELARMPHSCKPLHPEILLSIAGQEYKLRDPVAEFPDYFLTLRPTLAMQDTLVSPYVAAAVTGPQSYDDLARLQHDLCAFSLDEELSRIRDTPPFTVHVRPMILDYLSNKQGVFLNQFSFPPYRTRVDATTGALHEIYHQTEKDKRRPRRAHRLLSWQHFAEIVAIRIRDERPDLFEQYALLIDDIAGAMRADPSLKGDDFLTYSMSPAAQFERGS